MSVDPPQPSQTYLQLLLDRINVVQNKLMVEVQRRQKQYNELLLAMILLKKQYAKQGNKESSIMVQVKGRDGEQKQGRDGEQKQGRKVNKTVIGLNRKKTQLKMSALDDIKKPFSPKTRTKTHQSIGRPAIVPPAPTPKHQMQSPLPQQDQLKRIENVLQNQSEEITKGKQLSNYLMEQLLGIYQKINSIDQQLISKKQVSVRQLPQKNMPTQQTITSIVFQPNKLELITPKKVESPAKDHSVYLSPIKQNAGLDDVMAKIVEHQSILTELMELTRQMSHRWGGWSPGQLNNEAV